MPVSLIDSSAEIEVDHLSASTVGSRLVKVRVPSTIDHEATCDRSENHQYCDCFVQQYLHDIKSPPAPDACSKSTEVFVLAELREHILSYLPMQDLACVQRVNKSFLHSTRDSLPLRQALFLAPVGDAVEPSESGASLGWGDEYWDVALYGRPLKLNNRLLSIPTSRLWSSMKASRSTAIQSPCTLQTDSFNPTAFSSSLGWTAMEHLQ